jgi:hypothetical protein
MCLGPCPSPPPPEHGRKRSWFNFPRIPGANGAGAGPSSGQGGGGITSLSRAERAPLFGGFLSSDESGSRGGLLASLLRNK